MPGRGHVAGVSEHHRSVSEHKRASESISEHQRALASIAETLCTRAVRWALGCVREPWFLPCARLPYPEGRTLK